MGEVRNRNILIGIVDNDPYALKVFGLSPTKRPDVLVTDMSRRIGPHASSH